MSSATEALRSALLPPAEAEAMEAHGRTEAAVLVSVFDHPERTGLVFTERRADLRRHAGEVSFPGGRRDHAGEPLVETALREAHEEIGLDPSAVEVVGALPPVSTMVTSFKVHPFVGLIPAQVAMRPSPEEVEAILMLRVEELHAGYAMRRLVRRGVPFRTATYAVGEHLIWGATARIVGELLERLP